MRVVITTVLEIPDHAMNVNSIEQAVTCATRAFPTQAWNAIAHQEELRAEADTDVAGRQMEQAAIRDREVQRLRINADVFRGHAQVWFAFA